MHFKKEKNENELKKYASLRKKINQINKKKLKIKKKWKKEKILSPTPIKISWKEVAKISKSKNMAPLTNKIERQ